MAWENGQQLLPIYEAFKSDPEYHVARCVTPRLWGDQGFIADLSPLPIDMLQDRFPDQIVSYKFHCRDNGNVAPEGASIVCYHGEPKPWEAPLKEAA